MYEGRKQIPHLKKNPVILIVKERSWVLEKGMEESFDFSNLMKLPLVYTFFFFKTEIVPLVVG